jgi:hypothetical protein
MKCAEFEVLLSDALDGVIQPHDQARLDEHARVCPACAELAADCGAAIAFLARAEEIEPPAALVERLIAQAPVSHIRRPHEHKSKWAAVFGGWFTPLLQPRLAMGMAMTILSFSMVGRVLGLQERQLTMADLEPSRVVATLDMKVHRAWDRAVKYYENVRLVYVIQSQLKEWSAQEEEDRRMQSHRSTIDVGAANAGESGQRSTQPANGTNQDPAAGSQRREGK